MKEILEVLPKLEWLAQLGGTALLVGLSFYIWNNILKSKDSLIEKLLEDSKLDRAEAQKDREKNRESNERNTDKMAEAHEKGMSEIAAAIIREHERG